MTPYGTRTITHGARISSLSPFLFKERLIDPLQPVGRYLDGYRIAEMRESQIRPWPIHGTLNEPCPDWITKDIPDSRKKMAVLGTRNGVGSLFSR